MNSSFDWFDTPNPTERGFSIVAKEDTLSDTIPDFLNEVVLWSDCPAWIKRAEEIRGDLASYRLVHAAKAGRQTRAFYFAKVRTDAERAAPFHESWVKRPFSWPTVLLKLWAEEGVIPLSGVDESGNIVTSPSNLVRSKYKPGGMYPTWFRIRHFLSEKPFPRASSQRIPITDSIHWDFDGMRGGFPECLHPGVKVPNDNSTGNVVFGFGTPTVEIGADIVSQSYPPTPMTDWTRYVLEDDRQKVIGMLMEHRIIVEVFPPQDVRPPNIATA